MPKFEISMLNGVGKIQKTYRYINKHTAEHNKFLKKIVLETDTIFRSISECKFSHKTNSYLILGLYTTNTPSCNIRHVMFINTWKVYYQNLI